MNAKSAARSEGSRLNLFYILYVLSNYTDENHPMSAAQIKERADAEFAYTSLSAAVISIDTVKRTLEELTDKIFSPGKPRMDLENKFGFAVYCVMKKGGSYTEYFAPQGTQPPKKYYYFENNLKSAELLTLKDAVETYSYFSEEDITELIRKLVKLRPQSFPCGQYYDIAGEERDEDSLLLMNIEELNRIISNHNHAKICYCYYNMEKKLVPRPGYPKEVEPQHLMWSNGYYYLLVYSEKYHGTISMRVDRITDIEELEVKSEKRADNFNPVAYRHEHPIMFGGEKQRITMLCRGTEKNYIMNMIIDVFGKNAVILPVDSAYLLKTLGHDREFYEKQGITWIKVIVESTIGGVELWATQYCNDCIIISPKELRERVRMRLESGMENYTDKA